MRGRLPETKLQQQPQPQPQATACKLPDWDFDPVTWRQYHATDMPDEPTDEESIIQEHLYDTRADIQISLSQPLIKITPYNPVPNECLALLSVARVVQREMQTLQDTLSSCGRPPDQRDGDYTPAPNWDLAYLTDIINSWNEPVALEPDYYLLKSMCVYELGISIQVSVLGHEKVQKYMNMALTLAQRGERILKTKLGPGDTADRFWRYQTMMSYIYHHQIAHIQSSSSQADMVITLFKRQQESTGLQNQELEDQVCDLASRALRCFHRGMRWHPNVNSVTVISNEEPFKDGQWIKMANLADSCLQFTDNFATRQTWYRHTLKLLQGALYENRAQAGRFLGLIAKTHLEYALWIYEQRVTPLVVVPGPCPMFLEMQHASIAGKVINTLHMISLTCAAPHLIHLYIREASRWIEQLKIKFPEEPIDPSYLYTSDFMAAKDRAIQAITQYRQTPSLD
ncbi:hypothetical protein KI688_006333 [Linnemannia hyalina]|uniref:Uncharacterized protein n=1 Tax=Linnemannia hyalina TaxID=64524 RepID=A0A9P7Y2G7_9FUNG|nr:hypothetical protein KI688_006333 [Linnemannia hyalina]